LGGVRKPPPLHVSEEEVLEELDDDAIVAQQAALHSPARRANVVQDARTVVVADDGPDAGDTARLRRVEPGRHDPTLVLRAVRNLPPQYRPHPAPVRATPAWVPWVVWGIAGIIAFGIGGAVALALAKRASPPAPVPAATEIRR
jgi:hypothetical protein